MAQALDPSRILQTAFAFWSSKVLLTAVELDLFGVLGNRRLTADELGGELDIHPRGRADFFDALVATQFLEREGDGPKARYANTAESALFLDRSSPRYIGGILEMLNARLFKFWHDLPEALRTGRPQNEIKHGQKGVFEELYADLPRLEQFMGAMTGLSRINFEALAENYDFSKYASLCDVGGATGLLSIEVAKRHPSIHCISFDLPPVEPIARRSIEYRTRPEGPPVNGNRRVSLRVGFGAYGGNQGQKTTCCPFERLNPEPPGPPGSRYQNWK